MSYLPLNWFLIWPPGGGEDIKPWGIETNNNNITLTWITLGWLHRFSSFEHHGHWQVAIEWTFMRHLSMCSFKHHLSVSLVPKTGKTVQLPKSNSTKSLFILGGLVSCEANATSSELPLSIWFLFVFNWAGLSHGGLRTRELGQDPSHVSMGD